MGIINGHIQGQTTPFVLLPCRRVTYLGGESFDWLQVEIVVEMEIIKVLSVYEEVQHVVSLSTNLEPDFNPVELCCLEELCRFE